MQIESTRHQRTTTELVTAIVAVAVESRAVRIANHARLLREPTSVQLIHVSLRLRHHLHELHGAIQRSPEQRRARLKAVTLARSAVEAQLDRAAQSRDSVRQQLVARLALARTKFVMSTKADALSELALRASRHERRWLRVDSAMDAAEIARVHLATLWLRIADEVRVPVSAFAARVCCEVEASLLELGEGLLADALVDVTPMPLGTFDDEMGERLRMRADLGTLLVVGGEAIAERLLDYYDDAVSSIDTRLRDRLDDLEATVITAGQFADGTASGADVTTSAQQRVLQWSAQLSRIIEEIQ